jgi:hypothetical protein
VFFNTFLYYNISWLFYLRCPSTYVTPVSVINDSLVIYSIIITS